MFGLITNPSSVPPLASGMMWSGTVDAVTRPLVLQSLHKGSACSLRLRRATALRPLIRCGSGGVRVADGTLTRVLILPER